MIPTGEFHTYSAEDTFELGYRIGEAINEPVVFLLHGDLGAGKTVFAKGIAAGLDIDPAEVSSPTFTIINLYDGPDARMPLYHLDLYRIEGDATELREIGLEEILNKVNVAVMIEWPERLGTFQICTSYQVRITDLGNNERSVLIEKASD